MIAKEIPEAEAILDIILVNWNVLAETEHHFPPA